jgi:hypothetical protein
MKGRMTDDEIRHALDAIVEGSIVRRNVHSLFWAGRSILEEFTQSLREAGYGLRPVGDVTVSPGFRCPAFLIEGDSAYFGYVKWMKYDEGTYLKYFGSVKRRASGTPVQLLRAGDVRLIWVHEGKIEEHDADGPPVFE